MRLIGCDLHASQQSVAMLDRDTGVVVENTLKHEGEAVLTHPGVGPVTALATEVFVGDPTRFLDGKALASYVGMIPREYSSGKKIEDARERATLVLAALIENKSDSGLGSST